VNRNLLILATALALPASAAFAQSATPAGPGALAGRSPHQAYVADVTATTTATCGKSMHSLPAGKLPTYGTHALPATPCAKPALASADDQSRTARD
jgi:hypothetical protein